MAEDGCTEWSNEPCPEGKVCHDNPVRCGEGCAEICDEAHLTRCAEGGFETCESDEMGCASWKFSGCGEGFFCENEAPGCSSCSFVCDPAKLTRCNGQHIETCVSDSNGCGTWTIKDDCKEGQFCNPADFSCKAECTNACTKGAKQCSGKNVQECKDSNGDGCTEWVTTATCSATQKCDASSYKCVNTCTNTCTSKGAKDCSGSTPRECKDSNGDGCLEWVNGTACGSNKVCSAGVCKDNSTSNMKPFSIILLPDTQYYGRALTTGENSLYYKQLKWIVDNQAEDKENIKFVIHLGDITDNNHSKQWAVADDAHKLLDKAKIRYTISTGNHDYKTPTSETKSKISADRGNTEFAKHFNDDRYKKAFGDYSSWFSGFKYTANSYATFEAGGQKFMVIGLEFSPRKDVICWADNAIKNHPDHRVIIHTHGYLNRTGYCGGSSGESPDVPYGATGGELFNELVARHNNVIMAVGGHVGGAWHRYKTGNNGNKILEMLVDYQFDHVIDSDHPKTDACYSGVNSGNGWFRQLKFDPQKKTVQGITRTVLAKSKFANSKYAFYCSENTKSKDDGKQKYYYPEDPNSAPVDVKDVITHSVHNFTDSFDFTSSYTYKYDNKGQQTFSTRPINDVGSGMQIAPSVAVAETGAFVGVWQDNSSDADGKDKDGNPNYDIAARLIYCGGCANGKQFVVNANTAGNQRNPDVAMDKNGNFVVVWEDDSDGNGKYEIWMRGFKANGSELFARKTVNSVATGQQFNPEIAMAPDGKFVVAWEDYSNGNDTPQIFIRGFNANGTQRFADRNTEAAVKGSRRKPDIAMASDGFFVVTWEDDADANGYYEVKAKGFKADGTDAYASFSVNSEKEGQQFNPSVGMNANGDYYIAYEDDRDKNGVYRVWARGFKKDKTALMSDRAISPAGEKAHNPVVCVDKDGNGTFGYQADALYNHEVKNIDSSTAGDIRRRAYIVSAKKLTVENASKNRYAGYVNNVYKNPQTNPALACTPSGNQVWLWEDDTDGNKYTEIYGRGLSRQTKTE